MDNGSGLEGFLSTDFTASNSSQSMVVDYCPESFCADIPSLLKLNLLFSNLILFSLGGHSCHELLEHRILLVRLSSCFSLRPPWEVKGMLGSKIKNSVIYAESCYFVDLVERGDELSCFV